MAEDNNYADIPALHPTLAKVPPDARVLSGYVARSDSAHAVRLVASLKDQNRYVEFSKSDVLHFESDEGSGDGKINFWVKPAAPVAIVLVERVEARALPRPRKKLSLSAETISMLRSSRSSETDACISGEGRCTEGAGDCTRGCQESDGMACTWSTPC